MIIDALIDEIIRDNLSGAQELTRKSGSLFCRLTEGKRFASSDEPERTILDIGLILVRAHPAMASLLNLLNHILKALSSHTATDPGRVVRDTSQRFVRNMKEHNRALSAYVSGLIAGDETILTHSSSGSVRDALSDSWG